MRVVNTVGAGDTFQAAPLTWLAEQGRFSAAGVAGLDLPGISAALAFAAKAAAVTCGRCGADLSTPGELD